MCFVFGDLHILRSIAEMVSMCTFDVEVHIQDGGAEILVGSCNTEPLRFLDVP
jgi:hypothetical protein